MDDPRYRWQSEFHAHYRSLPDPHDYCLVACPGAGKTRAVLRLAREMLDTGEINFLWVVCPSTAIKHHWYRSAHGEGIALDWQWDNDTHIPADLNGLAVTYQSASMQPFMHRHHTSGNGRRTLVVFDEVHHATEDQDWGDKVTHAFERATKRICLSGTPYNPARRIAFLDYDTQGFVKADWPYGYREAVVDGVCRSVWFPEVGGIQEWWDSGKVHYSVDSNQAVSEEIRSKRLLAAISANFEKISPTAEQLLRDGDKKLSETRANGSPEAGGLVIAMGRDARTQVRHAEAIAWHMERIFGHRPVVVTSDDTAAQSKIDSFRQGTERWLVSIRMVSEGVDIPRLRVLVNLSNISTQLHFEQVTGRIARGDGDAWHFMPEDPLFIKWAADLANQRKQALEKLREEPKPPGPGPGEATHIFQPGFSGTAEQRGIVAPGAADDVLFDMHRIDRAEYDAGRQALAGVWPGEPSHEVISRYVLAQRRATPADRPAEPEFSAAPLAEQKKRERDVMNRLVRGYCYRTQSDFAVINAQLNEAVGIRRLKDATLAQLKLRMEHVRKLTGD